MNMSKTVILPIIGMIVLVFFVTLSYMRNQIFLDKLLLCSFILTIVFIAKMRNKG